MSARPGKFTVYTCLAVALLSAAVFAWRNHENFYETPIDFLVFARAGQAFHETGQLYQRADNYADKYHPSAAIFKFPPAFQLMLIPLEKLGGGMDELVFTRLLLTGMYVLSVLMLFAYLKQHNRLHGKTALLYFSLLCIISCWFMPFFECIRWLLTEIPLLFLFVLAFLLLARNPMLAAVSGALMAYAANAKIYPAFLFGYHLVQRSKPAAIGFVVATAIVLAASLYLFGLPEHLFYVEHILPVLLQEPVTDKWVNLNLEKFLFITGAIPAVTGTIFQLLRALFVAGLAGLIYLHPEVRNRHPYYVFSLFVITMFFCFPNYWPQYQVFLLIPIAGLLASYLHANARSSLVILLLATAMLFVPDLLWKNIMAWEIDWRGLDIEEIGRESWQHGSGTTMLKYLPFTWFFYYAYECRALVPVILWFLQAKQLQEKS